ncbi:hypothetical protein Tco_0122185 [Tanacetum coccineum]
MLPIVNCINGYVYSTLINELNGLRDQAYENSLIYKERTKKAHGLKDQKTAFSNVGDRVKRIENEAKTVPGTVAVRVVFSSDEVHCASPTPSRGGKGSNGDEFSSRAARQDRPTIAMEDLYGFVDMVDVPPYDYARSDVMSLRTTVVAHSALISELQSADHMRQRVISELLASDHKRQVQLTKTLMLLKGLQTQMVEFQRQHGPAKGPTQHDTPGEAGSSSYNTLCFQVIDDVDKSTIYF